MSKVSHSSDLTKCKTCGAALDVYVPPEERFCSESCCAKWFRPRLKERKQAIAADIAEQMKLVRDH